MAENTPPFPIAPDEDISTVEVSARLNASLPALDNRTERSATPRLAQLQAQLPSAENQSLARLEIAFSGAMILDEDPLKIGSQNFADLQNFRYTDAGLEGVAGYARLHTTALANLALRSGIQFIKIINGVPTSYVLVQAFNAGLTSSAVYQNTTAIPSTGNFVTTALHNDASNAGLGRFAVVSDGNVVYCNQQESLIWGSTEHRVAAVINYDDPTTVFRYDITKRMDNTLSDAPNRFTLRRDGSNDIWLEIGSVRPLQGFKIYVTTANTAISTSTVDYWDGVVFTAVSNLVDGTADAGVTLAQTGTMTFASTTSSARIHYHDERLLYFYRIKIGATGTPDATIVIHHITVDAPIQEIVDIWDGVLRAPISFFLDDQTAQATEEYTLDILEPSSSVAPIAAQVGGLLSTDFIYMAFEERMTALKVAMSSTSVNTTANTLSVAYWNGTAWTAPGGVIDGTDATSGASLGQSGVIVWQTPSGQVEFRRDFGGVNGYWYRLSWDVALSGARADVLIDTVTGYPSQRWNSQTPVPGFRFAFPYQNRIMLAGATLSNEGNRIDYSGTGQADVWNGEDSSDNGKQIYVGGHADLTAGIELANRFAGRLTAMAVLCKATETWLLSGSSPEDFRLFHVSDSIGCPMPLTMTVADISFAFNAQVVRNVAMWVSSSGPVMFDGGVLSAMRFIQRDQHISSVEPYFDPNDARYITVASMENARGWFDSTYGEYNILLPTAGSSTCNAWLCCDLRRRKWYRKVPSTYPQMGLVVIDASGRMYQYGGLDTGYLLRLENGTTWDDGTDTAITHLVDISDLLLSESGWDETLVRYAKMVTLSASGASATLTLSHASNGTGTFTTVDTMDIVGSGRFQRSTQATNLRAWSHQWRLSVSTNDKARDPRLIALAIQWRVEREELS